MHDEPNCLRLLVLSTALSLLSPSPLSQASTTSSAWGGEIVFRQILENVYCQKKRVPRVLLVVQGGPKTLVTVHEAVMSKCPIVLIADSGGVASMLHQYLAVARDATSPHYRVGAIPAAESHKYTESQVEILQEIAAHDYELRLISSFRLGESKSELDLHILNAIISDTTGYKPEARLKLAVEWNRVDVVERVLSKEFLHAGSELSQSSSQAAISDAMRDALQCAIEHRRVEIVKVLLKAAGQLSGSNFEIKIDFLSLYEVARLQVHNEIFGSSSRTLWDALRSEQATAAIGQPTSVQTYKDVLSEFLNGYVPYMAVRLERMRPNTRLSGGSTGSMPSLDAGADEPRSSSKRATFVSPTSGASPNAHPPGRKLLRARSESDNLAAPSAMLYNLSFSDLMLWAVLIGDLQLAEVFWCALGRSNRGDPIRLALLAAQTSTRAAEVAVLQRAHYARNAEVFEGWACELLRKCDESSARVLLLREHDHWPRTVLHVAMRGHPKGCKKFIGGAYVQRLVDRHWRGHTARGCTWQLPENVSSASILLHCMHSHITMQPPTGKPAGIERMRDAALDLRRFRTSTRLARSSLTKPLATLFTEAANAANADAADAGGKMSGAERTRGLLQRVVALWEKETPAVRAGYFPMQEEGETPRSGSRTSPRPPNDEIYRRPKPKFDVEGPGWKGFLAVPRVKFVLKLTSYSIFLVVYVAVLLQRGGRPEATFTMIDVVFFVWAVSLFVEEMYQWEVDWRRNEAHLIEWVHRAGKWELNYHLWNIIDVLSLSILVLVLVLRIVAIFLCLDTTAESATDHSPGMHLAESTRRLRGSGLSDELAALTENEQYQEHWAEVYTAFCHGKNGSLVLWVSQVLLSINAIPCFLRVLNWMTVWEDLGTLSVILIALMDDVKVFILIFGLIVVGFASAFVGLMPTLGQSDTFSSAGAFQAPFWAVYGEFGELDGISRHGSAAGTALMWLYAFISEILLVNLLIAMMTETCVRAAVR